MKTDTRHRISHADLRDALENVLARRIQFLRRRRSVYSSSCPIETLDVTPVRGKKLRLVFKVLSPTSELAIAREIRPRFLYAPGREIEIYQTILNPARLGTAHCHGAVKLPARERYWLFLERVDGPLLWQTGSLDDWERAARWLADLHSLKPDHDEVPNHNAARHPAAFGSGATLLHCDQDFFGVWIGRAEQFLRKRRAAGGRQFARLANRYDRVVRRLSSLPTTFIHGEFYPSNIIVRDVRHTPICAIDWELAGLGPGVLDLAALTSGNWNEAERRRLVAAYHETGLTGDSLDELQEAVAFARLHLCVQMLGWAADWSPPAPHAQNWLRTALQLADQLGL